MDIWGCPFCAWSCKPAAGGFDYGLIEAHLYTDHREVGDGLFPRDLLALTRRTSFVCPIEHADGRPWLCTWASDGAEAFDPPEENPYWSGDADIGLELIAQHMEAMHPEAVYGPLMPAGVLNKLRRVGVRGSPGVRLEA